MKKLLNGIFTTEELRMWKVFRNLSKKLDGVENEIKIFIALKALAKDHPCFAASSLSCKNYNNVFLFNKYRFKKLFDFVFYF